MGDTRTSNHYQQYDAELVIPENLNLLRKLLVFRLAIAINYDPEIGIPGRNIMSVVLMANPINKALVEAVGVGGEL